VTKRDGATRIDSGTTNANRVEYITQLIMKASAVIRGKCSSGKMRINKGGILSRRLLIVTPLLMAIFTHDSGRLGKE